MKRMSQEGKKTWLSRLILGVSLLIGAGEAWGAACAGTAYLKVPSDWTDLYIYYGNTENLIPSTSYDAVTGYYVVDLSTLTGNEANNFVYYTSSNGTNIDYPGVLGVNGSVYNQVFSGRPSASDLTCPGIGGVIYVYENPAVLGTTMTSTEPPNAQYFYFLPPDEPSWYSSLPMISFDGGVTGVTMTSDPDRCGWFYYVWFGGAEPASSVTIFRDTDTERDELIGYDGWDNPGPAPTGIPMKDLFSLGSTIYFISDPSMWPAGANEADKGFFVTDPGIEGNCTYNLAALIYDTDASVNPLFSEYQGVTSTMAEACVGVHHGIVDSILGADNKPKLSNSANAISCFGTQENFNTLFNYTAGKNEVSCYDLPFARADDGRWAFDSDEQVTGTTVGGFYPVEDKVLLESLNGVAITPLPAARTLRNAEGPVTVASLPAGISNIDYVCNGPGWSGGIDCEGMFVSDDETGVKWQWDVAPNGTKRWQGQKRNQHFCFESHANFTYREGQKFTFRGDDDIWVFIGGKLAVDNGGAHLATPGYVELDKIKDKNGNALIAGESYAIDIFFCDRRTTMSNVIIKTNMYIQQNTGIDYNKDTTYTGEGVKYEVCYEESGNGDCASMAMGTSATDTKVYCGKEIENAGLTMNYNLYKGGSVYSNGSTTYDSTWFNSQHAAGKTAFFGGVNLSDWYGPVINKSAIVGLPSGSYKLVASIGGKKTSWSFRVAGSLDVLNKDGKDSTGHVYSVKTTAMADVRIPVFVGAIGEDLGDGYLDVDLEGAVGESYSVTFSDGLLVYEDSSGTTPLTSSDRLTVGARGVDTVWVTVPLSSMTSSIVTGTISVRKTSLELSFQLPAIAFVDSSYSTQLEGYGNKAFSDDSTLYRGADYTAYVMMFDPTTGAICESCNYGLEVYPAAAGVTGRSTLGIVNGKGEVNFRSSVLYPTAAGDSAYFTVATMENALISATWRGLTFIEPPVPVPDSVLVFDTKGKPITYAGLDMAYTSSEYLDGIADSIWIHYHRPFHKDSLPDSIVVEWSLDSTEYVTITRAQIEAAAKVLTDTTFDSVLVFNGLELSSSVQTGSSGKKLQNYASFKKNGAIAHQAFASTLLDRVAPIITRANISERSEGLFSVKISFSEAVKAGEEANVRELFGYYLRSATDLVNKYQVVPATNATVVDSAATMIFNLASGTIPQAGDYARAVPLLLTDAEGNSLTDYNATVPSPWMLLEGDAASTIESIKMGIVDNSVDTKAKNIFTYRIGIYDSLGTIAEAYPNTVGYLIKTDMGNILTDSLLDAKINNGEISLDQVRLHYELDIFTNLGTFVAHRSETIACSDSLFNGDCRETRGHIFVGWNMVSDKGRKVGTGAYIAKLSTYAKMPIKGKTGKHNVTQTWGVRRGSDK